MNITTVGQGKVVLLAGDGKCFTDVAGRFISSERALEDIIASPHDKRIVDNIIKSGHLAATEFDNFIFGIEGYARVTEVQLVRKRLASYCIKTGRAQKGGKRRFDVVLPPSLSTMPAVDMEIPARKLTLPDGRTVAQACKVSSVLLSYDHVDLLAWTEQWYNRGVELGFAEENLRYMKQQATEFKAIVSMNCRALRDWLRIRMCMNAQTEIRDLATKMFKLARGVKPELFIGAGPNCVELGYCPEGDRQHPTCKALGRITKEEALKILSSQGRNIAYVDESEEETSS